MTTTTHLTHLWTGCHGVAPEDRLTLPGKLPSCGDCRWLATTYPDAVAMLAAGWTLAGALAHIDGTCGDSCGCRFDA